MARGTYLKHTTLTPELESWRVRIDDLARSLGLDYYPVEYELIDWDTMAMVAAYGGFPRRYPHWRHGMSYDELQKSYRYGLSKIYELVINTDPVIAYLLTVNPLADHKLVMAHVYGHADFFKNNAWFAGTNRKMLDEMANHASTIKRYADRYGLEAVEGFLDIALSLENLIDPYSVHVRRIKTAPEPIRPARLEVKPHLERHIQREEEPEVEEEEGGRAEPIPARPERDVLAFLMQYAPLRDWQRDVLGMVREEAYYFAPQGMTKVMNEGWASFWHSRMMTMHLLDDTEVIHYADVNSGVMGGERLNPYKLGLLLWRDIEERWDRGRHGADYDACDDLQRKRRWDMNERGAGLQKLFEVRRTHNDVMFIDEFLTQEFCEKHRLFVYELDGTEDQFEVVSREFGKVKQKLLHQFTNSGQPIIRVMDANFGNRGELFLEHAHDGEDLEIAKAKLTLENLFKVWTRPVNLKTLLEDEVRLMRFDGQQHQFDAFE
jgi:stage V sporulation protein R